MLIIYFFGCSFRCILLFIVVKNILKHIILFFHYVDLLILSSIQLDFLFYIFSVITMIFQNCSMGNLIGFEKFRGDTYCFIGWGLCSLPLVGEG
jgi:hypothetical protein